VNFPGKLAHDRRIARGDIASRFLEPRIPFRFGTV
jgi:hypothetical protein